MARKTERVLVQFRYYVNEFYEVDVPQGLSERQLTDEAVKRVLNQHASAQPVGVGSRERAGSINVYRKKDTDDV